jgi:acylphosphatase
MAVKRVRVVVSGDVQGVGFRWSCRERATGEGVAGFVRNLPDGRVEAVFEGDEGRVDRMVEWCRQGPNWGRIDRIEVEDLPPEGQDQFVIAR